MQREEDTAEHKDNSLLDLLEKEVPIASQVKRKQSKASNFVLSTRQVHPYALGEM